MAATIYYDQDADLAALQGKTVAILGYGSQGHAHAQNLRDSGVQVVVGQRPGSANYDLAVEHGFEPLPIDEATQQADIVNILLPDEVQADIYREHIRDNLQPGNVLMCSHGFNVHFGQIEAPQDVDLLLVAPKGPGHLVRSEFVAGGGVPGLIAVEDDASETTFQIGLAYAKGIGCTRGGVIRTSFAEETETDLFGEQAVLCGVAAELVKAGFETLVDAGYLKRVLEEIQDGTFARNWILENKAGAPGFKARRRRERQHPVEIVGKELRKLMSWIDDKVVE